MISFSSVCRNDDHSLRSCNLSLYVYPSVYLTNHHSSAHPSIPSIHLSTHPSLQPSARPSFHSSLGLLNPASIHPSTYSFLNTSIPPPTNLSLHQSLQPAIYLAICQSIHLLIHTTANVSFHLPNCPPKFHLPILPQIRKATHPFIQPIQLSYYPSLRRPFLHPLTYFLRPSVSPLCPYVTQLTHPYHPPAIHPPTYPFVYARPSPHSSAHTSIHPSINLFISPSSIHPTISPFIRPHLTHLSVHTSIHSPFSYPHSIRPLSNHSCFGLPVHPSSPPPAQLSVQPTTCTYRSTHLSVSLSIP